MLSPPLALRVAVASCAREASRALCLVLLDGQHLLRDDKQQLDVNPVEVVEAVLGLAGGQPVEKLGQLPENDLVTALVDHARARCRPPNSISAWPAVRTG